MPRNSPKALLEAPIDVLAAWTARQPDKRTLSRQTINNKALGALSAFLTVAMAEEHVQGNATDGLKFELNDADVCDREPYTLEQLNAIFATAIYGECPVIPRRVMPFF